MEFIEFFKTVMSRIFYQLDLFDAVEKEVFNKNLIEDTWAPDAIFRHIIWSLNGLNSMFGYEKIDLDGIAVKTGDKVTNNMSIQKIKELLDLIFNDLTKNFNRLSSEDLKADRTTFYGSKTTLEGQLTSSLLHITEHIGELRWQFKRLTGWTDSQVYSLKK